MSFMNRINVEIYNKRNLFNYNTNVLLKMKYDLLNKANEEPFKKNETKKLIDILAELDSRKIDIKCV